MGEIGGKHAVSAFIRGGLIIECIFYLQVDGSITGVFKGRGELISGGLRYCRSDFLPRLFFQYPEVLKLEEELAHVRSAAKVK